MSASELRYPLLQIESLAPIAINSLGATIDKSPDSRHLLSCALALE